MKSPYQRIMQAYRRGIGVRLSAADVNAMAGDSAIVQLAMNDDDDDSAAAQREPLQNTPEATQHGETLGNGSGKWANCE